MTSNLKICIIRKQRTSSLGGRFTMLERCWSHCSGAVATSLATKGDTLAH